MQLTTILTTILKIFATSPDLCADVYVDANGKPITDAAGQTLSRYCQPAGPDALVLDFDVCCTFNGDAAACVLPNVTGACSTGLKKMYCEHGELTRAGVTCQQPFMSACDFGFCEDVQPPDSGPLEDLICCWGPGDCIEIEAAQEALACYSAGGLAGWCDNGSQNADGSVDCFD
jgi:hypothetical protein